MGKASILVFLSLSMSSCKLKPEQPAPPPRPSIVDVVEVELSPGSTVRINIPVSSTEFDDLSWEPAKGTHYDIVGTEHRLGALGVKSDDQVSVVIAPKKSFELSVGVSDRKVAQISFLVQE